MPYRYSPEFRRRVLDLLAAGRSVASLAEDLGVSDQTIYKWRRQDRIDRGLEPGPTSVEKAELQAARRRIRELETELAVTRRAIELLKARVVSQKTLILIRVPWPGAGLTHPKAGFCLGSDLSACLLAKGKPPNPWAECDLIGALLAP